MDIVICHGPNDNSILDIAIKYNKENILYRNIYIITYDKNLKRDDCIVICEDDLPFKELIIKMYPGKNKRWGWYLQQLLKIHAHTFISDISEYYLTIDCDTIFIKPTSFFDNDIPLYNYVDDKVHQPYLDHMKRMHNGLIHSSSYSGICHHMIFNTKILNGMYKYIETEYNLKNNTSYSFAEIFLICIDDNWFLRAGASEYEIYFNYLHIHHKNEFKLRKLYWDDQVATLKQINNYDTAKSINNYISCHHWRKGR
jgi:hypothetical protein